MNSSPRHVWGLVLTLVCASGAACAPTVIVEGEGLTATHHAQGGTGGDEPGQPPDECPEMCDAPAGGVTCSCVRDCNKSTTIACQWITTAQGEQKMLCVCTIKDLFSGACYEKNEGDACDFEDGCCAKYFSGK